MEDNQIIDKLISVLDAEDMYVVYTKNRPNIW